MRAVFIVGLAISIVAAFASRELSVGIALADTDLYSIDYPNANIQGTESASEVMTFQGEQTPGLPLDDEISLLPWASDANSPNSSLLAETTLGPIAAADNPGPTLGTEGSTKLRIVFTIALCLLVVLSVMGALIIFTCLHDTAESS